MFRHMQTTDSTTVAEMMKSLYQSLQAPADYLTDEKIAATFKQVQNQTGHLQLEVFEIDKILVGYALLFQFWYNEFGGMVLNIDELFVKPDCRSLGIASLYLSELTKRKEGYVAMSLEVLPENKKAYQLYKRNGFIEKETITLYRLIDH